MPFGPFGKVDASCEMVTSCPPMVSVVVRDDPVVLASTLNVTAPLPLPELPFLTTSQDAPLDAVHAQPDPAVICTLALFRPDAPTVIEDDDTDTWQVAPADCVTDTDVPAIVTTAERGEVLVLGVAVSV